MKKLLQNRSKLSSFRRLLLPTGLLALSLVSTTNGQGLGIQGDLVTLSDGSRSAQVYSVVRGGIAQRLGVRPGDTILTINNSWPGNAVSNQRAIQAGRGSVTLVVNRNGRMMTLDGNRTAPRVQSQRQHRRLPARGGNGNSLRAKVVGAWWATIDGETVKIVFSGNGRVHCRSYDDDIEPIVGSEQIGRWKLSGETLVLFVGGQKTSTEIISATREELDVVNLDTNASLTLWKNLDPFAE